MRTRTADGRSPIDSSKTDAVGPRSTRSSRCRGSHGVLYFATGEPEENASCPGTYRYLRQAWKISEITGRQARRISGSPAQTGTQEEDTESACTAVQRGSRSASRKVQAGQTTRTERDFRERTFWRN